MLRDFGFSEVEKMDLNPGQSHTAMCQACASQGSLICGVMVLIQGHVPVK